MSDDSKHTQFPEINSKLSVPAKKSAFARERAEIEAKRAREEAENAAALEDFVKSFDDGRPPQRPGFNPGAFSGTPKRHFSARPGLDDRGLPKSGPGSLGPSPTPFRKQAFERDDRRTGFRTESAFEQEDAVRPEDSRAEERAAPKPTLLLANLPQDITRGEIRGLFPDSLNVESVRMLPAPPPGPHRKSHSAIITLHQDTPSSEIDQIISSQQNRYLGYGFYLNITRHLSSAALGAKHTILPGPPSSQKISHPFGAKILAPVQPQQGPARSFAPPGSYNPSQPAFAKGLQVPVKPPADVKELKMIHKTIELVLARGPEAEALLMSRPEVQYDEKWAWIWDARSPGGVWYRWRLWDITSGFSTDFKDPQHVKLGVEVFESSVPWTPPEKDLKYEFVTELGDFVDDDDYNTSSDEEDFREQAPSEEGAPGYLNPFWKAKLEHLLTRLPTSTGLLRKGDIARITAFAIDRADAGIEEVVKIVVQNILSPFAYRQESASSAEDNGKEDRSSASLIGLFVISDILSSSSTSGVRHAWKYRSLFETELLQRRTFTSLGNFERDLAWGKLKAEKWRRSVANLLSLWEGWCVFSQEAHEKMVKQFNQLAIEQAEAKEKELQELEKTKKPKWRAVDPGTVASQPDDQSAMQIDDDYDLDGEPIPEGLYSDLDDDPMDIVEDTVQSQQPVLVEKMTSEQLQLPVDKEAPAKPTPAKRTVFEMKATNKTTESASKNAGRGRVRAVDMFADDSD